MFDLKRTYGGDTKERPVAAGETIAWEGLVLRGIIEDGKEVASLPTGTDTSDEIIGFSLNTSIIDTEQTVIEEVTMPSGTTPQITLSNGNIIASTIRVYNVTDSVQYTAGVPGANTLYSINLVNGILVVGDDGADDEFRISYRYAMTEQQRQIVKHDRPVNSGATTFFGLIAFKRGNGEIYTDRWDTTVDWSTATHAYANAGGFLSPVAGAKALVGRVISLPTVDDPMVGVAFNLA